MDKITIKNLKLFAYHGVNSEEKENGQNFFLDIDYYINMQRACQSDDLNDTVSYAKVVKTARAAFTSDKFDLKSDNSYSSSFELDTSHLAPGEYQLQIVAFEPNNIGNQIRHDYVAHAVTIEIFSENQLHNFSWSSKAWGDYVIPPLLNI